MSWGAMFKTTEDTTLIERLAMDNEKLFALYVANKARLKNADDLITKMAREADEARKERDELKAMLKETASELLAACEREQRKTEIYQVRINGHLVYEAYLTPSDNLTAGMKPRLT